ncbi:MAG: universal stress protein [Vulcanimicrobiota bacterium]
MKIENLLVPLDGSELSLKALEHAEKLAHSLGAKITLLRVGHNLSPEAFGIPELSMAVANELTLHQARSEGHLLTYLEEKALPLRERGLKVEVVVRQGDPASQIVDLAESEHVDLVVMSSHGRTGLTRWIYGSVAERVLHNVRCSLMVVRIPSEHLSQ